MSRTTVQYCCLLALVFQTTGHMLLTRVSRGIMHEKYLSGTVVLMAELFKFFVCLIILIKQGYSFATVVEVLQSTPLLVVPAACFFLQNNMVFVALENLDAPVFAVLNQVKLATTAFFSVIILKRNLGMNQWKGC